MATREQAKDALASLRPKQVFLDLYDGAASDSPLWPFVGVPDEFFYAPATQVHYCQGGLIPILDDGNFGVVVFVNSDTGELTLKSVEAPLDVLERFTTWEQYLAYLFFSIAGSVDDDAELVGLGELIGFASISDAMAILEPSAGAGLEDCLAEQKRFISGLASQSEAAEPGE